MYTYRITKYNPKYRNSSGAYTRGEWTQFSDIGKKFNEKIFTKEKYIKIEDAYVNTLLSFLEESGIAAMKINKIQNFRNIKFDGKIIKRNQVFPIKNLKHILRFILRGKFWAKFKNRNGSYIDFGWDYYSYIGVPKFCKKSVLFAKKQKLYVEKFPEPILD